MKWTVRRATANRNNSSSSYGRIKQIPWRWKWHDACYRRPCCRQYVTGGFANSLTLPTMFASGDKLDMYWLYIALYWYGKSDTARYKTAPSINRFIAIWSAIVWILMQISSFFFFLSEERASICTRVFLFFPCSLNSHNYLVTFSSVIMNIAIIFAEIIFWCLSCIFLNIELLEVNINI